MAPYSSTLAWKIPWTEGPGGLQSMRSLGVGHDWATSLSLFTFLHWRKKWQPTPVFLPGESQAAVYGVAQSRTRLKRLSSSSSSICLATSCEELTHWKRLWCWKGLGAGGEGDDRGWDGWMASPTWWTWVWVNSGSWWWTGRPGVLRFMGSQRVGHDWATELNWTEYLLP